MSAGTPSIQEIVTRVGDLPAMPQIALKVTAMINDPHSSPRTLQTVIQADPALSARILKMSNSAFYGGRKCATLVEAIMVLGYQTLKALVLASSTEALFSRGSRASLKDTLLWEHSLGCALGARLLADKVRFPGKDQAFICGLLHDIGKTIMSQRMPQAYDQIIQRVYEEGIDGLGLEKDAFGFDHTEIGAAVAGKWNFSPDLQEAIRCHHEPWKATESPMLAAVVAFSNALCIKAGIGPESRDDLGVAGERAIEILKIQNENFDLWVLELQETLTEQKSYFN